MTQFSSDFCIFL